MSRLQCRVAMHDAERHWRNAEAGNRFTLSELDRHMRDAQDAYLSTPEPNVARRLMVAIDRMGDL